MVDNIWPTISITYLYNRKAENYSLAHMNHKAYGWAYSIGRPLSSVCLYVCKHFQTSSPLKPLGRLKPNFMWSLLGMGERKCVQIVQVTCPRWPPCPHMVKTLKIFFSETKSLWPWNLVCTLFQINQIKYLNLLSSITTDFNIYSALRWAIEDQRSSG